MWELKRNLNIAVAHHLRDYVGPCANHHGHNLNINIYCRGNSLNKAGMLIDLVEVKQICNKYDHKDLNEFPEFGEGGMNPTMENIAKWLCEAIPYCYKVEIDETPNNTIAYLKDE